ncbi:hypothetical protein ACFVAJ_17505 [Agromyces sp. NPDC057679]|uniref:hypothetical protein n=1 Tax=Agromyces sp. NPDC057679 TaxID=3346207 RepID=UPI003672D4CF
MLTTLETADPRYGHVDEPQRTKPKSGQKKPKVNCSCTDRNKQRKKAYPNLEEARQSAVRRGYGTFRTYKCPDPMYAGYFHLTSAEWPPVRGTQDGRRELQDLRRDHRRDRRIKRAAEAAAGQ